jgi:hypothetical protein
VESSIKGLKSRISQIDTKIEQKEKEAPKLAYQTEATPIGNLKAHEKKRLLSIASIKKSESSAV